MNFREHDGLKISEIGVGCYSLAGVYGEKDRTEFTRMLCRAYELGVNFFDTAQTYGEGEQVLGEAINPFRQEVILATKLGTVGKEDVRLDYRHLRSACEDSLRRLQTDWIDLYQIHFDDAQTPVRETISGLDKLVEEGKIRRYGVCHLPVKRVEEYLASGRVFSVLMEISAVARQALEELLPLCAEHNAAAIAFSVTGRGLLTGKYRSTGHFTASDIRRIDPLYQRERFESGLRIAKKFEELGRSYGKTAVQTAIAWVLAQPQVVCALTGPSVVQNLEENVGGSGWQLSDQHLIELERFFEDETEFLRRQLFASLEKILSSPLPDDAAAAFADLVYVIETAILLKLFTEEDIMPLFLELYALRDDRSVSALLQKEKIKEVLRSMIPEVRGDWELS
jgi:aryl-alcohol dehydrogenase-like predicted oxidoreductase